MRIRRTIVRLVNDARLYAVGLRDSEVFDGDSAVWAEYESSHALSITRERSQESSE
jgi:hypothetical protein